MSPESSGRNLIGYGNQPPVFTWPNGSRVAISIVVNFEEGAELQVGDGDSISERVGEVISVVEPTVRDIGQEQIFAYGMRVGLWRFLDSLNTHKVPATFFFCGKAVVRSVSNALAVTRAGHEAACHGWRWLPHANYESLQAEKQDLVNCIDTMRQTLQVKPEGFFCRGSESIWTRAVLASLGFTYTSNAFDDDLPYRDSSGLIVVPYNLDCNDMKYFHPNGFVLAGQMVEYVKDAVYQLLIEAKHGKTSTLSVGFHLRISGRPARFRAFSEITAFLASLGNQVWLARRIDIARHFNDSVPPVVLTE